MQIQEVRKSVVYYVTVDDEEYRTDGSGNWERLYGESWETEYHEEELDLAFKKYMDESYDGF